MEEYVPLAKIVRLFEDYSKTDPRLHSFGFGDLTQFGYTLENTGATYAFMFVTPISINYNVNITNYQFSIIFADKLNDDLSNQAEVVSDMSLCARRFLSEIYINSGSLFDFMTINLPTQTTPFLERMNDVVAGVVVVLDISVFEDMNACVFYVPEGDNYYLLYENEDIMTTEGDDSVQYEH